ncbi:MAG TPA: SPOR domain-containing protein [Burkholderiales bacterium]|jgi:cell division protein FtsN
MAQRDNSLRGNQRNSGGARSQPRGGSKTRGGTLIGIVLGLVLGLVIAVGVALFLNKGPKPFADKTGRDRAAAAATKGSDKPVSADPNAPLYGKDARTADAKKDGKDEDRFSFYKILPGDEKASTAPDAKKGSDVAKADTQANPNAAKDAPSPTGREQYYLQVGAYSSAGEADNQKAKLALMGFEAKVEDLEIDGKGLMHRVRVGPYGRLEDINRVRATLAQNGVDASLVRMKDAQK